MTDLQYMAMVIRRGQHSERVAVILASSLAAAGYKTGGRDFVEAPSKVRKLVSELSVRVTALLEELDPSRVSG